MYPVGVDDEDCAEEENRGWWDVKELNKQLNIALPMILVNLSFFLIPLISVMFAGHLGDLQLAGSTLANSWSIVTGLALMVGLSGALETLCGQHFGARMYGMLGIYLQSSCIISVFFFVLIAVIWWYTQPILVVLHQNSSIAKESAIYIKYFIPGIFAYGFIQNILRFFQTQSVVIIPMVCALVPLLLHVGIAYVFVHLTSLGYRGAPLAASVSFWISLLALVLYLKYSVKFRHTSTGLSMESFGLVFAYLKLALPSAATVCLEYWSFEIMVLIAGLMPDSETTTSIVAMCVNTQAIAYMLVYGLSAAVSTRVSNELGAGNPKGAKRAMWMNIAVSATVAFVVAVSLGIGHNIWASLFSDSSTIISGFASLTPFLVAAILLDSVQAVFSGVCRGCGWQYLAMYTSLVSFYLIGMPISCVLAFKFKMYAKGLWIGTICGLASDVIGLFLIVILKEWRKREEVSLNGSHQNPLLNLNQ